MMRKTLLMGLFSLALFATFTFAFTTNVSAAPLPRHTPSSQLAKCNYPGNNSVIYLNAHANGKYVFADLKYRGYSVPLVANSTTRDTWERFDVIVDPVHPSTISLRAHANGEYVFVYDDFSPLEASSTKIDTWERFDWGCVTGNVFTLRAHFNGKYVTADLSGGSSSPMLYAESPSVDTWERFDWSFA